MGGGVWWCRAIAKRDSETALGMFCGIKRRGQGAAAFFFFCLTKRWVDCGVPCSWGLDSEGKRESKVRLLVVW